MASRVRVSQTYLDTDHMCAVFLVFRYHGFFWWFLLCGTAMDHGFTHLLRCSVCVCAVRTSDPEKFRPSDARSRSTGRLALNREGISRLAMNKAGMRNQKLDCLGWKRQKSSWERQQSSWEGSNCACTRVSAGINAGIVKSLVDNLLEGNLPKPL
jgi:hypothetical protein